MTARVLEVVVVVLAVSLLAGNRGDAQQEVIRGWPIQSPYYPQALADGVKASKVVAAVSEHLRGTIEWASGQSTLIWSQRELDPNSTNNWCRIRTVESWPHTTTAATAREGGREVYVAGVRYNGGIIIQKWSYAMRPNGWALTSPTPPAPLGTSMPEFVPVEILNGSSWSAPPATGTPALRSVFWTSNTAEVISSLAVDPEGRSLLAVSYPSGNVLRFNLSAATPTPVVLFTAAQEPYLDRATTLDLWEHASEGRKLIVSKKLGGWTFDDKHVTFSDANNDGIFEAHAFYDATQWTAASYDDDDSFRKYWNAGVTFDWDD